MTDIVRRVHDGNAQAAKRDDGKRWKFLMGIRCHRCSHQAEIPLPLIGRRLRCTACGQVQIFGVRNAMTEQPSST